MPSELQNRRAFLAAAVGTMVVFVAEPGQARSISAPPAKQLAHPQPRAGIDASKVLTRAALHEDPESIPVFDMVRTMPQVVDGIRCHCGCADLGGHYSLLSCFEGDGMARHCEVCRGQARLAFSLHERGKTLREIRKAIDEDFG